MPISPDEKIKVLICMGTRPEIIKQAPVVWAARENSAVVPIVCHSGQHADLAEPMLSFFDVQPDIHLDLMKSHDSLASLVGGCIQELDQTLKTVHPNVVVVQGDTATSAATALACFYSRVPVVHVEAGLRTGDLQSPWPEEMNRRIATHATTLHCAPSRRAADHLYSEGVPAENVLVSGNPVVDALNWTLARPHTIVGNPNTDAPAVLLTAHRRENFGAPLESICSAVLKLSEKFPDHHFRFVTHPNPQAGPVVQSILDGHSRIELVGPMSYQEFVYTMKSSRLIISDSGGIQEEAPTLKVPLLITRESTERPEAIDCGAAELVGTDCEHIVNRASALLSDRQTRRCMQTSENPFGNGQAGKTIIHEIVKRFGPH